MPAYEMLCEQCGYHNTDYRSIHQGPRKKCPKCKSKEPEFHQVYAAPILIVRDNPTTFGQMAEINAKRLGKEQMEKMKEEFAAPKKEKRLKLPKGAKRVNPSNEVPWFRSGEVGGLPKEPKPIDLTKISDVKKYIKEGKK